MKKVLLTILLNSSLLAFSQGNYRVILTDTSKVAILPTDSVKTFILSEGDIANAEIILANALNKEFGVTRKGKNSIDIKRYHIQLVPYLNAKNGKEIWVSCFCSLIGNKMDWKKEVMSRHLVDDGGACFFDLVINLEQLNYHGFGMNGTG